MWGEKIWDVVVIGAGPAGAVAAALAARRDLATLLVERKKFPRDKVCGGCLSAPAVAALRQIGFSSTLDSPSAAPIESLQFIGPRRSTSVAMPGGAAIIRSEFDHDLTRLAEACGAAFLAETSASIAPELINDFRRIDLQSREGNSHSTHARVVLACDGLGCSSSSRLRSVRATPTRRSRMGVGTILDAADDDVPPGVVCMAIGRDGYVGRVRLGDGRMSMAAAVDRLAVRTWGASTTIQRILAECQIKSRSQGCSLHVNGTLPLTRQSRRCAAERIFLLGDACGYVEPFTGDGMATAIETALAVIPLVEAACLLWRPRMAADWQRTVHSISARRRTFCRGLSGVCRWPRLVDVGLAAASRAPTLVASLVAGMNRYPRKLENATAWDFI